MATKSMRLAINLDLSQMPFADLLAEIQNEIIHCGFPVSEIVINEDELSRLRPESLHLDLETSTGCKVTGRANLAPNGYILIG